VLYKEINKLENYDLYNLFRTKLETDYKEEKERRHINNFKKLPLMPGFEKCEDLPQLKYVNKIKLRSLAK
jgi:hypothetical protein